ncbi:MAG: prolipoprotein diacylglyceryl transferase [Eubacteriales bacterium]|nr:prolipoprotein diacylglyceryl transferase [Eubacteriales bacterium]MDD3881254.1 prolipoprotein diacylglyceryl transferase [Eubacteriales bacterium]MDD4512172.1 prolipoprotein diacylglyceryl transferase [Eubacteriales bacterium]
MTNFTLFSFGALTVTAYGLLVALAAAVSGAYFLYRMRLAGADADRSAVTLMIMAVSALAVSRLFYAVLNFDYLSDSLDQPLAVLRFWEGGFSYWGAAYGAFLAFYLRTFRSRNKKLGAFALPAFMLFLALMRLPEIFSSVGRGAPVEAEGVLASFPFALPDSGETPCAAICVYELFFALLAFAASLLLLGRGAGKYVLRLPLAFYCLADVLLQSVRQDENSYMMAGFVRIEQVLAMVLVGVIFIFSALEAFKRLPKARIKLIICSTVSACAIAAGIACEYALDAGNDSTAVYIVMTLFMLAFFASCAVVAVSIPKEKTGLRRRRAA